MDLAGVVRQAVATSWPLLQSRRHDRTVSMPETPLAVRGDPVRLVQIATNLLTNAARYTEPQGRIEVQLQPAGEQIRLSVRDSGIGIAPDMLERIFEPFVQADSTRRTAQDGIGVGLTLVRRLAQLHGGDVDARSAGPGQGSEFTVHLPALQAAASAPPDVRAYE